MPDGTFNTPALPFQAEAEAVVARQEARRAAHPRTGVCWSAMTSPAPEVQDVETVRQRLVREAEERRAFQATPRGRFLAALRELHGVGYFAEFESAMSAYSRGFSSERYPADPAEVARAIKALNGIAGNDARSARAALCDLLIADGKIAEAA